MAAAGSTYAQTTDFSELLRTCTPKSIPTAIVQGEDVNARNSDEVTPLLIAARYRSNPEVISILLKAGADLEVRDSRGATALKLAAESSPMPKVIAKLCPAGAGIYFYTGVPSVADKPFWNHFWTAKMAVIGTREIHTFSRALRYRNQTTSLPDGTLAVTLVGQEKGVDVRMPLTSYVLHSRVTTTSR
jgi:hypothetical protein